MIDLVQERTGEKIFAGDFDGIAFDIAGTHHRLLRAAHRLAETGNAETSLLAGLLAFLRNHFGIDKYDPFRLLPFLGPGDVNHRDPLAYVDLRRCQTDAMRSIHGFEHVLNEAMERRCVILCLRNRGGRPFED